MCNSSPNCQTSVRSSPSIFHQVEEYANHYCFESITEILSQTLDATCVCLCQMALAHLAALALYRKWLYSIHIALFTVSLILTFSEVFPILKPLDFMLC